MLSGNLAQGRKVPGVPPVHLGSDCFKRLGHLPEGIGMDASDRALHAAGARVTGPGVAPSVPSLGPGVYLVLQHVGGSQTGSSVGVDRFVLSGLHNLGAFVCPG